jgi:hypothetical protein
MTTSQPPEFYFNGIDFNPDFFEDVSATLTKKETDARYLIKTESDIATALETFNVGIKTNSIEPINETDTLNINTVSSTATNIVNIGNNTTNNQTLNLNSKTINIGDTSVPSSVNILSSSVLIGTSTAIINFGSTAVTTRITPSTSTLNIYNVGPGIAADSFNLCSSQTAGNLFIGTASTRTGAINICNTLTTGVGQVINIGSNVITSGTQTINLGGQQTISGGGSQTINLNKPLTVAYTGPPSSIAQFGGIQEISATYSNLTTNSTKTICSITNLNIGVFMVFYSIKHILDTIAINYSLIRHGITNTANSFTNIESNIYISHPGTKSHGNDLELIENNCGIITISPALQAIHLTANCTFTTTSPGTVPLSLQGLIRVVRIG